MKHARGALNVFLVLVLTAPFSVQSRIEVSSTNLIDAHPEEYFCYSVKELPSTFQTDLTITHEKSLHKAVASKHLFAAYFKPFVIRDNSDYFSLTLGITDSSVDSIRFTVPEYFHLLHKGSEVQYVTLTDHSELNNNEGNGSLFFVDSLSLQSVYFDYLQIPYTGIKYFSSNNDTATYNEYLSLKLLPLDPNYSVIPNIVKIANNVYRTDYAVEVVSPLNGLFPQHYISDSELIKTYFSYFPDDRDFLFIWKPFNTDDDVPAAQHRIIKNDVSGIGMSIFDDTELYGSDGNLKGISEFFSSLTLSTLNHEIFHQWGVYYNSTLNLSSGIDRPGHWGVIQRPSSGFGGPPTYSGTFTKIENSTDGNYRCLSGTSDDYSYYSDIELYMMGLKSPSEIQFPIPALINPLFLNYQFEQIDGKDIGYVIFKSNGIRNITLTDIIANQGERIPNFTNSQKKFRAGFIIAYNRLLSDIEFAYCERIAREYEKSISGFLYSYQKTFEQATGGRATLETKLPDVISSIADAAKPKNIFKNYKLFQNFPNPFNPFTTIRFELPRSSDVRIEVFNLLGQRIETLVSEMQDAGSHEVTWDGSRYPSGVYLYRLQSGAFVETRKMMLVK